VIDLTGKVALVTGASRGIGQGCALKLAELGADVVVNYRSHGDEAEAVAQQIRAKGRECIAVGADIGVRAEVEEMVAAAISRFGRIDLLINNAALTIRKYFVDLTVEELERVLAVSMWGAIHTTHVVAPHMIARGEGGRVVIMGSVHATVPFGGSLPYNVSKGALNLFSLTLAREFAPHRITVNVVEPGWIDTHGERDLTAPERIQELGKELPLGRVGTVDDIANAVAYLCSDEASYVTGALLRVDGGFVLPRKMLG